MHQIAKDKTLDYLVWFSFFWSQNRQTDASFSAEKLIFSSFFSLLFSSGLNPF